LLVSATDGFEQSPASPQIQQRPAEMWEISENLHRAELAKLERDEQIARKCCFPI
jgi:hypothetical protein